jgi:mannose-6-phosphate isomerase-like protein (cupin superfamily)
MLQIARFEPAKLQKFSSYNGHYTGYEDVKFDDPACMASFSEKRRGDDLSVPWHFWNDEVWYIIQGEAELTWSEPPLFNGEKTSRVTAGDLVWVQTGMSVAFTVLSEQPLRFLWVVMPRPRHFGTSEFAHGK